MKETEKIEVINDENKNYLNIITNNINNTKLYNKNQKDLPKFPDILSISSNPEEIFTLLYPIGHDGFGTVYKAIHKETKRVYAIKTIDIINGTKNKSLNNVDLKNNFQNLLFNFNYSLAQQESSLMKLCQKSKYIVNYYGSYYSNKTNTLWLILEYCPAGSIIDLMLSMNRVYTEEEISTIIKNVLQGLILIHSKNLIHRDIKAANIFLSEDGHAKLGDFGVGTKLGIDNCFRNSKKGSPYWMSPQVVKNLNYDMKTDIWSLGITCCEMCNGKPPFSELDPKNAMEKIGINPPKVDAIIKKEKHSKEFYDFVKKCLEIEPENRPSAKELINHGFIIKYAKDNNFLKELIDSHIDEINRFRNFRSQLKDFDDKEKMNEFNNTKNLNHKEPHHEKNNCSNITSHFYDNDLKPNYFKEKENLLIKMISSSSNIDNNCLNSTKDSKNQIKEEKGDYSSKTDFKNFPTFHKVDEENNINEDESFEEVKEIHNLCKSFDITYFIDENKNSNNLNKNKNGNKIKLTKNKNNLNLQKINLLLDKDDKNMENNIDNFEIKNKIIYTRKTKNKSKDKVFSKKIKSKYKNIINKSSDNLYIKQNKTNNNKNLKNFIYVKSKIKKQGKNNFIFKKPIISSRIKNFPSINDINRDSIILNTASEEGHINNTNFLNVKSNFDIFKIENKDFFSNTNYLFRKNLLRLSELNINKNISNGDEN